MRLQAEHLAAFAVRVAGDSDDLFPIRDKTERIGVEYIPPRRMMPLYASRGGAALRLAARHTV
jgi:hypothetical protein